MSGYVQIRFPLPIEQPTRLVSVEKGLMSRCSGFTKVRLEGTDINGREEEMAFLVKFIGGMKVGELVLAEIRILKFFNKKAQ